jgi:integrase
VLINWALSALTEFPCSGSVEAMQLALWPAAAPPSPPAVPRARPPALPPRPGGDACVVDELAELAELAKHFEDNAHAANTKRAYQADWNAFEAWCKAAGLSALPASTETLELYLAHLARRGLKVSTIRRARCSIGLAHGHEGLPRPDQDTRIRALERGVGRLHGAKEQGASPLLTELVRAAVRALGDSPREDRDRALITVGFGGAFRSSELAGFDLPDVTFTPEGVTLQVRRSKEDQLGKGRATKIDFGKDEASCPVLALKRWIGRLGRPSGPLFRVIHGAVIEHERIHPRAVSRAVQRAASWAAISGHYSAHSLRRGHATSADEAGASVSEIQAQGGWEDARSVYRYIDQDHVRRRRHVARSLL